MWYIRYLIMHFLMFSKIFIIQLVSRNDELVKCYSKYCGVHYEFSTSLILYRSLTILFIIHKVLMSYVQKSAWIMCAIYFVFVHGSFINKVIIIMSVWIKWVSKNLLTLAFVYLLLPAEVYLNQSLLRSLFGIH